MIVLGLLIAPICGRADAATATLSWRVELESGEGPLDWTLVGGPSDLRSQPEGLDELLSRVNAVVEPEVEKGSSYLTLVGVLKNKMGAWFPDQDPLLDPPIVIGPGPTRSQVMTISFQPRRVEAVRLVISGGDIHVEGGVSGLILGDHIELDPRVDAILGEPRSLLDSSKRRAMDPQLGAFAGQVAAWGDRLSIQVVVAASDLTHFQQIAGAATSEEPGPEDQLEGLAVRVLSAFPKKGIEPGMDFDHDKIDRAVASIVREQIGIGKTASSTELKLEPNGRLDIWVMLDGLPSQVRINKAKEVDGSTVTESWEEVERDYITSARGQANRLLTSTFRYPYRAALRADTEYLPMDPRVVGPGDYGVDDQGVDFEVRERARVERRLMLTGTLRVAPETGTSLALSAELAELFEPEQVKKLSLSVEGGERTLAGDGELVIPVPFQRDDSLVARDFFARAKARQRQEALYGNQARPPIEEQKQRFELGLIWSRDSLTHRDRFEAEDPFIRYRPRPRLLSRVEAGLRYLDVNLAGDASALTGLDQGAAVGPYIKGDAIVAFLDPSDRLGGLWRLDWENDFDLSGGAEALGGDDDYARFNLTTGLRAWQHLAGVRTYLRHRWTGAWASNGTPTYAYFGAGASDFIRGLEEDEYIGRRFVGAQNEIGVNLYELWKRMTNQQSGASQDTQTPQLRNLYGALFADIGWLSQRVQDGQTIDRGKYLMGYGVLLGINNWSMRERPADISFGYAYSPQSERNASGVVFAQINYQF